MVIQAQQNNFSSNRQGITCHICGSSSYDFAIKDGFKLFKCSVCSLVFVYPQPPQDDLAQKVYSGKVGYQANKIKDISQVKVTRAFCKVLNFVDSVKKNLKGNKVCDIGASNGEFLYAARARGYDVCGVELNESTAAVAHSHGLNVFVGTLSQAGLPNGSCDIVHMGDLIEHVPSPRDLLKDVQRILNSKGYVIISTPNLNCIWAMGTQLLYRLFGIPVSSFTPPHHLFQFSDSNLDILLKESGFVFVSRWYNRRPSLRYELGALHIFKRVRSAQGFRKIREIIYIVVVYSIYTCMYLISNLVYWLVPGSKDFSMVTVAQKVQ